MCISLSDTQYRARSAIQGNLPEGAVGEGEFVGILTFFFFSKYGTALPVSRRKQCPRAAELTVPQLFPLPGSSLLPEVKAVVENRISSTERRNKAISFPLHVLTAAFHHTSFSLFLSGDRLEKQSTTSFQSLIPFIMVFIPVIFHQYGYQTSLSIYKR